MTKGLHNKYNTYYRNKQLNSQSLLILVESEHKGQVATFNLHNENYAHTHTPKKQFIYFNLVITFQTQS